jgi:hypothetical protein
MAEHDRRVGRKRVSRDEHVAFLTELREGAAKALDAQPDDPFRLEVFALIDRDLQNALSPPAAGTGRRPPETTQATQAGRSMSAAYSAGAPSRPHAGAAAAIRALAADTTSQEGIIGDARGRDRPYR